MTSSIYAVVLAILMCWLAIKVIAVRRRHKVLYADGDVSELQIARSAHANASEYIPIALLLLFALEYNGAPLLLVHLLGSIFVLGRLIHARGMLAENLKGRILGMQMTLFSLMALAISNIVYFPYASLWVSV